MTPEIASKIIDGMRLNLKQVVLPALKDLPYPTAQAVSMYTLLKTLSGYASPDFQRHIQKTNDEISAIFVDIDSSFDAYFPIENEQLTELRSMIANALKIRETDKGHEALHKSLMESLVKLIKALWSGVEMNEKSRDTLKEKVNTCLRNQLNGELALFN